VHFCTTRRSRRGSRGPRGRAVRLRLRRWEPAGADTPDWAYDAIVYNGPDVGQYTPSIVALVSKPTGNVDPHKIIDLAPGGLNNLPGWKAMNEGEASTLSEYPAYQLGGTWTQDGQTEIVAQKTAVIPGSDGLYVLQLNADGLEDQKEIIGAATDVIQGSHGYVRPCKSSANSRGRDRNGEWLPGSSTRSACKRSRADRLAQWGLTIRSSVHTT
jgi:hypothetical protein